MKAEKYHNSQKYAHPPSLRSHLSSLPMGVYFQHFCLRNLFPACLSIETQRRRAWKNSSGAVTSGVTGRQKVDTWGWSTSIIFIIWHWGMSCTMIASFQPLMYRDYEKGPYDHSSGITLHASAFCPPDLTRNDHTWLGLALFILQEIKY